MNLSFSLPPSSIQSFGATSERDVIETTPQPLKKKKVDDVGVECECGSTVCRSSDCHYGSLIFYSVTD